MSFRDTHCPPHADAALVLADGTVFYGRGVGTKNQSVAGELCFNTAMTGYQEVLTDPSYAAQIIVFTFPHVGNVGTNSEDVESRKPAARGLVLREPITSPSNFRSERHFDDWLSSRGITGIYGIDTRALTRKLRLQGPQNAVIYYGKAGAADYARMLEKAKEWPQLNALDLTKEATCSSETTWREKRWQLGEGYPLEEFPSLNVVVIDYGTKSNILRELAERGCQVSVVPAESSADEIMQMKPDGVLLSNGPGDPLTTAEFSTPVIQALLAHKVPIFGICLGHQLLAIAAGAKTEKMRQGHRGANHPIRNIKSQKVEITSQNHGYVVAHGSMPKGMTSTHLSLFDGTIAGIALEGKPAFSVQYHPEASPGPHDSCYLFDQFVEMMRKHAKA